MTADKGKVEQDARRFCLVSASSLAFGSRPERLGHQPHSIAAPSASTAKHERFVEKGISDRKPKEAEVYATYLKKLSDQEKEIDTLTAKQKKLMGDEFTALKKYEDYLANISD